MYIVTPCNYPRKFNCYGNYVLGFWCAWMYLFYGDCSTSTDLNLKFPENTSISQSVSQQHVDSFMPAVLLTVTARSLPAIIKYKTRNCCRSCGRRAPARLVWATGTPSLLRTPANCPHSKHNVAGFECRHDWFRVVTNAIDLNWNWNITSKKTKKMAVYGISYYTPYICVLTILNNCVIF